MRSKWVILGAPLRCADCTENRMCEDCYAAVTTEEHHARESDERRHGPVPHLQGR
jgi:hypothetical protein